MRNRVGSFRAKIYQLTCKRGERGVNPAFQRANITHQHRRVIVMIKRNHATPPRGRVAFSRTSLHPTESQSSEQEGIPITTKLLMNNGQTVSHTKIDQ